MNLRASAYLLLACSFLFGCAASSNSDTDDTGPGTGGTITGQGGGGMPSSGPMGGNPGGMGGMGGAMGGMGGMGGVDPCAMGCPIDTWDIDDNPLTGECGCEYACVQVSMDDPIDPAYTDENCDGGDGVVEACVYVSKTIGTPGGAGTRTDPVQSIAQGIAVADQQGVPSVCLSGESYDEAVEMVSGISVYGGFDHQHPDFVFKRTAAVTTVVNAPGTVFHAVNINQETHIAGITMNASTPGAPGESTYGVRLESGMATLFVRYNVINTASGAPGADGADGSAPGQPTAPTGNMGGNGTSNGSSGGVGGLSPACVEFGGNGGNGGYDSGSGQNGTPGTGNAPVGGGAGSDSCFGGGNAGGTGGSYITKGAMGGPGQPGGSTGAVFMGGYTPANGTSGTTGVNGKGGSGGGGGGGGEANCCCNADRGGGGGSGGCGGLGGAFGTGGQGGGGSFAVFGAGGLLDVVGNSMTTSGGGHGGNGGDGAIGQFGGGGGPGGSGPDDSGSGGSGGSGSQGGAGGPGAGGGGGPSACFAYGFGVTWNYTMNTLCQVGPGGLGGSGAGNPDGGISQAGATGAAGATLQIKLTGAIERMRRALALAFAALCAPLAFHMGACAKSGEDDAGTGEGGIDLATGGAGGIDPDAACALYEEQAVSKPVNLYVMFDKSSSMAGNKWNAAKAGLGAFLDDPKSAGVRVALNFFPRDPDQTPACDQMAYAEPEVPFDVLPDNATPMKAALDAEQPDGFDTPMWPALGGAILKGIEMAENNPGEASAVLLVTDGKPVGPAATCAGIDPEDPQEVANLAATGLAFDPSVVTYIVGLPGVNQAAANLIAQAGGSEAAILVSNTNVEEEFRLALAKVRGEALPCEYDLPPQVLSGMVELGFVNVEITHAGGDPTTIPFDPNCSGEGWKYDDPEMPTAIVLCPETCAALKADLEAAIQVVMGCATFVE